MLNIKLIDYTAATTVESIQDRLQELTGTHQFIAPEVYEEDYSSKCDIWSFGCLVHAMLTGNLPIDAEEGIQIANMS